MNVVINRPEGTYNIALIDDPDTFVCLRCTLINVTSTGEKTFIHHKEGGPADEVRPPFTYNMTYLQQIELTLYMLALLTGNMASKIASFGSFVMLHLFDSDVERKPMPEGQTGMGSTYADAYGHSFNDVARDTDRTEYPMFPGDIENWVSSIRQEYAFPRSIRDVEFEDGVTFDQVMIAEEVMHFAVWLEEKCHTAGVDLMIGERINKK